MHAASAAATLIVPAAPDPMLATCLPERVAEVVERPPAVDRAHLLEPQLQPAGMPPLLGIAGGGAARDLAGSAGHEVRFAADSAAIAIGPGESP